MRVTDKVTAEEIWGYFIKTYESLHDMNRVFIGSIGDYSDSGRYAEGYIDNVRLYTEQTVTVTPTEVVTTPATIPATKTTRTTARPMTTAPTPTPTSPVPPAIPFAALVIAGSALAIMKIRKKQ
jgi:hypothetical protein